MMRLKSRITALSLCAALLLALCGCASPGESTADCGQIYLYGETHGKQAILDYELEQWQGCYAQGMRHLFIEAPYYTAQLMNLWMAAEDDSILDELYRDSEGTLAHSVYILSFYRRIKESCPETVFHGTDIGHQYGTTGERYLNWLTGQGMESSQEYERTQENIFQGKTFYAGKRDSLAYRENTMTENFLQEYESLKGECIMGIYGSAHTALSAIAFGTEDTLTMASQLQARYGEAVHVEDVSALGKTSLKPIRTDQLQVEGMEYQADYYGREDISAWSQYAFRDFWLLRDAYADFADTPPDGDMLPAYNYPMPVEAGQIYAVAYTDGAGNMTWMYYRAEESEGITVRIQTAIG